MIAQKRDLPALTRLWQRCFGDAAADIDAFWQRFAGNAEVFCRKEGEKPTAMVCALPVSLIDESGEARRAAYLYAVCTHPDHRGRGLCTALLAETERTLQRRGVSVTALVPSSPSLFDFYARLGYQTAFVHKCYRIDAENTAAEITKLDAAGYRNLRELLLFSDFVSYDERFLRQQAANSEAAGAGLYRLETAQCVCIAAAEKHGEALTIKELLPDEPSAAAALAAALGCKYAEVCTAGGTVPFAMAKALDAAPLPTEGYLGLALD